MASVQSTAKPSARERLLAAANELFYAEGVQTVGIDRVIEHAGVAKASLYNTFGGKEQLVRAYLDTRHQGTADRITRAVAERDTPREQMLAVFESQGRQFERPDFHGCAFIRAAPRPAPAAWSRKRRTPSAAGCANSSPVSPPSRRRRPRHPGPPAPHPLRRCLSVSALMDHDSTVAATTLAAASALITAATGASA